LTSRPDLLVVQGDTTSAFVSGLAAFYRGIALAHVEAGLRTSSPADPFPEEMNRRLIGALATVHFAPTPRARRMLLAEGVSPDAILITGNTIVDAIEQLRRSARYEATRPAVSGRPGERLILVTLHRRESLGDPLAGMCRAIREVVVAHPDVR